jgi:glutathione S-transferase
MQGSSSKDVNGSESGTNSAELVIVGRSTSHFTRITRVFAAEGGLDYVYRVVPDLRVTDPANYAGNPALRIPILRTPKGEWFGSLNICREIFRLSRKKPRVIWPEDLEDPLTANAQELIFQGMANEVTVLMSRFFGEPEGPHAAKLRSSLANTVEWLEGNVEGILARLPADRELSYLELSWYCFLRHVEFRELLSIAPYAKLTEFCRNYEMRQSVKDTHYRLD